VTTFISALRREKTPDDAKSPRQENPAGGFLYGKSRSEIESEMGKGRGKEQNPTPSSLTP